MKDKLHGHVSLGAPQRFAAATAEPRGRRVPATRTASLHLMRRGPFRRSPLLLAPRRPLASSAAEAAARARRRRRLVLIVEELVQIRLAQRRPLFSSNFKIGGPVFTLGN